jgi:tetraacyldisaccharide 4'-kinase
VQAPEFWHGERGQIAPRLLAPLSVMFAAASRLRRLAVKPWRAPVPVICVGNLTVGGAGKTPTVLALVDRLQATGLRVGCLSRGYGGSDAGPLEVDRQHHRADQVGDEPLLLANAAPTWIARDRKEGARAAIGEGVDMLVLDDGLQNPALHHDLALVVVDAEYGFGNGRLLPAGPLREPVAQGLRRAGAVVLIGEDRRDVAAQLAGRVPVILRARLVADDAALGLKGRKLLAFAGIGRPAKFFTTLEALGADIVERVPFADHHRYTADEAMQLVEDAQRLGATPVTTAKDFVRLPEGSRQMVTAVGVHLEFHDPAAVDRLLEPVLRQPPPAPHKKPHG